MHDPVNSPSHYPLPGLDCEAIDVIRAVLTPEQFDGYCLGNMLKYLLRQGRKDEARQDWGKVGKYHEFLMAPPGSDGGVGRVGRTWTPPRGAVVEGSDFKISAYDNQGKEIL